MLIRDIMTRNPITASPWTTIGEVAETLLREDIRHLPIVDAGAVVGVISDRDVRQFARDTLFAGTPEARRHLSAPVTSIMSTDVIDAAADDDVDVAIERMIENKIGALPVIDGDGVLVGILSTHDVLKRALGRL
ncbi:MAG: CBS domain-containing protein [Deltaproteobacteria bacterium]|nr:CBS domain-containing protein [Deltaproteobacteria bacterium]